MKSKLLALLVILPVCLFLTGCESESDDCGGNLPWARPASWQGKMPGLGCGNSSAPGKI